MGALVGEDREAEVQGDEVVGADQAPDRDIGTERADRADREHAVATLLHEWPKVGDVVDLVWKPVDVVAVALHDRGAVLGGRRGNRPAPRPQTAAPQYHRQSAHREPILSPAARGLP